MSKEIQLFLLPFAGGSSSSFNKIISLLDNRVETFTIEYPGRGNRSKEAFITDYVPFRKDVVGEIEKNRNRNMPYAILGYSMGSAVAFDIISKRLLDSDPFHLFICARGSLKEESPSQKYVLLSEKEFVEKIIELGGIDQRILQNDRFREIYFRPLKADYQIWSKYSYHNEDLNVPCDITVMFSENDATCINPQGWSDLTDGDAALYEMGTNHFFINEHYKTMADLINKKLLSRCGEK